MITLWTFITGTFSILSQLLNNTVAGDAIIILTLLGLFFKISQWVMELLETIKNFYDVKNVKKEVLKIVSQYQALIENKKYQFPSFTSEDFKECRRKEIIEYSSQLDKDKMNLLSLPAICFNIKLKQPLIDFFHFISCIFDSAYCVVTENNLKKISIRIYRKEIDELYYPKLVEAKDRILKCYK